MAVEYAPDDPGVIILWDGDDVIYVGRTREGTIRSALLCHLEGAFGGCTKAATHYSWEITIWQAAREVELLGELASSSGSHLRCQPKTA